MLLRALERNARKSGLPPNLSLQRSPPGNPVKLRRRKSPHPLLRLPLHHHRLHVIVTVAVDHLLPQHPLLLRPRVLLQRRPSSLRDRRVEAPRQRLLSYRRDRRLLEDLRLVLLSLLPDLLLTEAEELEEGEEIEEEGEVVKEVRLPGEVSHRKPARITDDLRRRCHTIGIMDAMSGTLPGSMLDHPGFRPGERFLDTGVGHRVFLRTSSDASLQLCLLCIDIGNDSFRGCGLTLE